MRIPRAAMTPALDAAIRGFVGNGLWFRVSELGDHPQGPDHARDLLAAYAQGKAWVTLGWTGATLFTFLIGMLLLAGESALLMLIPALLFVGTAIAFVRHRAIRPDAPSPTVEFLGAALPRLDLAPVQRHYAETLVDVTSGRASDPEGEGLALLRRLTDEEERLLALARTVEGARSDEVAEEVTSLRARHETARDPGARDALAHSLDLAERRLDSAARADGMRERLEAHQALLDQASRTAAEGVLGRGDLPGGLDGLRANVAALGNEAAALEAAVQEMRAL